jgi:hypothetical protein
MVGAGCKKIDVRFRPCDVVATIIDDVSRMVDLGSPPVVAVSPAVDKALRKLDVSSRAGSVGSTLINVRFSDIDGRCARLHERATEINARSESCYVRWSVRDV